jgi:hypothetical protein
MSRQKTRGRGGGDRDAALLLLFHPVHDGSAFVDLTDLVRNSGVEEDPLGGGRLPGIDVRHDANVPCSIERCLREALLTCPIRSVKSVT